MSNSRSVTMFCAAAVLACGVCPAHAGVPGADLYLGVGVGQSDADLSAVDIGATDFDKQDLGWKVVFGGRFLSYFGAEAGYIDFGKPEGSDAQVKYKGVAGFGLFYLPIPLPVLDVYAKAGMARVDTDVSVGPGSLSSDDTKFAYGAGLQLKFGSWALRSEYEQFKLDGAKPTLLSVSFTKSFL